MKNTCLALLNATFHFYFVFYFSTGKYVCHHPILKQSQCYVIGGRDFNTIDEAVSFYRTSPLGEAILTEQVMCMSIKDSQIN